MTKRIWVLLFVAALAAVLAGCSSPPPPVGDQIDPSKCNELYASFAELKLQAEVYDDAVSAAPPPVAGMAAEGRSFAAARAELPAYTPQLSRLPGEWVPGDYGWYTGTETATDGSSLTYQVRWFEDQKRGEFRLTAVPPSGTYTYKSGGYLVFDDLKRPIQGSFWFDAELWGTNEQTGEPMVVMVIGWKLDFTVDQWVTLTNPPEGITSLPTGTCKYYKSFELAGLTLLDDYCYASFTSSITTSEIDGSQILYIDGYFDKDGNTSNGREAHLYYPINL